MGVPQYLQNPGLTYDQQGNLVRPALSLSDLYSPSAVPDLPSMPNHLSGMQDLSEEDRARLRRQAILQAVTALNAPGGQVGTALAGAAQAADTSVAATVDERNKQADQQYQIQRENYTFQRQHAEDQAAADTEQQTAQNRLHLYQQISQADPALAGQAEGAARGGDDATLQALWQAVPQRAAEQKMGLDPNDPFVHDRVKAQLQAQEDANKRKAVLDALPAELKIKNDAELGMLPQKLALEGQADVNKRRQLNAAGLLWDPKAGHDPNAQRWEPKLQVINGHVTTVDFNKIDPLTGKPTMVDLGAAHSGKPIYRQMMNSQGVKETWVSEQDPETGVYGDLHPAKMNDTRQGAGGAPTATPPGALSRAAAGAASWIGSFLGSDKTQHPTAPAPKATGGAGTPARPSPMLEQPAGAPGVGRGQGPQSPLRGKAATPPSGNTDPTEATARQLEQQLGKAIPPQARALLKQRLAAGADPAQELQHLQQMSGGQ